MDIEAKHGIWATIQHDFQLISFLGRQIIVLTLVSIEKVKVTLAEKLNQATKIPYYFNTIEFIEHKSDRQIISKAQHTDLIMSTASNLGLFWFDHLHHSQVGGSASGQIHPYQKYKDFVISWSSDCTESQIQARRSKQKYLDWRQGNPIDPKWQDNVFQRFKDTIHNTYCEWFYFPIEKNSVFENNWHIYKKRQDLGVTNDQVEENIRKDTANGHPKAKFYGDYPFWTTKKMGELALYTGDKLINNKFTGEHGVNIFMKHPFLFFPNENVYVNYFDAVHFQRGIQNMKVRDIEFEINIPDINGDIDYNLIQKIWWVALEYVEKYPEEINIALEMRLFKGSNATLAPEVGYGTVCSIEILRSKPMSLQQEVIWREHSLNIFRLWRDLHDSHNNQVLIRPHWGKEWSEIDEIKKHVLQDQNMKTQFRKFIDDYEKITTECKITMVDNLRTFSNDLYRELINNALIGTTRLPIL